MKNFLPYFWNKIILAIPTCFLTFTQSQTEILFGIVLIISLDTILGMWVALKYKLFSSHHLSRVFSKIGTYGIAMMSVWAISAVEPEYFGWLFRYMGMFIIITEIFSNFEKLALLGFRYPGMILAKLNKQFLQFINIENGQKDNLAEDILKNRISNEVYLK